MDLTTLSILIADDDNGDRMQLKRVLKKSGLPCEISEASDIKEALVICQDKPLDISIIDYQMPGQNGLEGIKALHALFPSMSIIMVTGQGDEIIASEAIKQGASDYIPKGNIDAQAIRRVIENALEKKKLLQKIEEQQTDLKNFAKVLVHDLKAPIRSLNSLVNFLKEDIQEGNQENILEGCQHITKTTRHLSALIDTLRDYTEADKQVEFETVSINTVLQTILEILNVDIKEKKAQITFDPCPEVTGNTPLLTQLLQHLVANGIKYCEKDTPTLHVSADKEGDAWKFTVKDNGIGIPKKDLKKIFAPFTRLHGSDQYSGTGLGLATCKKIVEKHGGKIWCESKENEGSTFFFTLPKE